MAAGAVPISAIPNSVAADIAAPDPAASALATPSAAVPDPAADPGEDRAPSADDLRGLRLLRVLVTVLTGTMIAGIVALVLLLYLRLPGPATLPASAADGGAAVPSLPDAIILPEGARAQAVTAGPNWWAVVTETGDILLYDAEGTLTRRIPAAELARP